MARTRKQQTSRPAGLEDQKVRGVSSSPDASGTDPNTPTRGNSTGGRKTANTGRASRRAPVQQVPSPSLDLEEFAREAQVLLQDLRRTQQEASEARQELHASLEEMRGLIGELRRLREQEKYAPSGDTLAEATEALPDSEDQSAAQRGWLGVTAESAAVVVEVEEGSPAQTAHFAPGDVITAINGVRVHDAGELRAQAEQIKAGEKVAVRRIRRGQAETVEMRYEGTGRLGVTAEPAVLAAEVLAETPAQAAGLAQGDVISSVNGVRVFSTAELQQRIEEAAGEDVAVELARGEQVRAVRVHRETSAPAKE